MSRLILAWVLASLGLSLACAKKRPIEQVYDKEGNRWPKSTFLSSIPWMAKVTIVKTSDKGGLAFVGAESELRTGFFEFSRDKLSFYDAMKLYPDGSTTKDLINSWNITHSDYHLAKSGGRITNREEENPEIEWYEKRYFKVDWSSATISEATTLPFYLDEFCWQKQSSSLVEDSQEISPEHISFTLAVEYELDPNCITFERYQANDYTHTLHYKYSFAPLPETDYEPYVYTDENDPLFSKYGYFVTVRPEAGGENIFQNRFLMNRWHPKKTHKFYFAEDFPEKYKKIYNDPQDGIIAKTNALFEENDVATRFEIVDNDGSVKFGDVRYSFIKFVQEYDRYAPLGFGPSNANPFSGELLAANSVIWTGLLEYYIKRINDQLSREPNVLDESTFYAEFKKVMGNTRAEWTSTAQNLSPGSNAQKVFDFLLPQYTFGRPGNGYANLAKEEPFKFTPLDQITKFMGVSATNSLGSFLQQLDKKAREVVNEEFNSRFIPSKTTVLAMEPALVQARKLLLAGKTPEEIIDSIVYRTAIHEFGHNLNLRHNFYGSVDLKNFRAPVVDGDLEVHEQKSSSVMEYMALKDELYFHRGWEKYDEAALVYAYSSGERDLSVENKTTYLYCTDEHVAINALCNRWDSGSTPSEVALSLVENFEDGYWVRNHRYGRPYWSTAGYDGQIFSFMWDMKKFLKLNEQTYRSSDVVLKMGNFESLTAADFQFLAGEIQEDIKQSVLVAAASYAAILQQPFTDRPYTDTYDTWSGALQRKGIASDKIFAAFFLLGDDGFTYNPNNGATAASFLPLRGDGLIGNKLSEIILNNVTEPGDMYLGFNNFSRVLYAINAVNYIDAGGTQVSIDELRLACFQPDTLELRFNIADSSNITSTNLALNNLNANADPYFADGQSTEVAIIRLNSDFYVASKEKNPISYDLINRQLTNEILNTYNIYYSITAGRVPECR